MDTFEKLSDLAGTTEEQGTSTDNTVGEAPLYDIETDGISESLDNIFAAVIVGGINRSNIELARAKQEVYKQAHAIFRTTYRQNIFKNEYAFLHSVITSIKVPVFTWPQLDVIINNSADEILTSEKIDLSGFATFNGIASTDEEKLEAFKYLVKQKFDMLSNKYVTLDEFNSACIIYNACYKEEAMLELVNDMAIIMSSGLSKRVGRGRKRVWKGVNDAQEYFRQRKAEINSIDDTSTKITSTIINQDWLSKEMDEKHSEDKEPLVNTNIVEIDSVHGSLHRGNMLEFMGPPKGGKTTLATWMVDICLSAGLNVAVWPLEGSKEEWLANLETLMMRKHGRKNLSKKDVLEEIFENDADRQLNIAVKNELALGEGRGQLSFIEGICYVEDMIDDLLDEYSRNAYDVIVIDSPVLALSRTGKPKAERIGECYTILKNFINNRLPRKALAIVTAQLKQTVVDELRANPTMELTETAGGESAETIRTPDYVICIVSTKEERRNQLAKLQDVAVRHTDTFKPFYLRAEYGSCYFSSDAGLNAV